ncbi:MAG: hypothetical protein K5872_05605 [Rhizobiaceae bacterium]|nr:hypothetical protein [Rhizobiaceae bacterium]MCV0405688.1 hypothetical protein [Rhizobiaceae bacterium]
MPMRLVAALLSASVIQLAALPASADDRLGIRPGMGIAEIRQNLKDRCDDLYGNPYVTCTRGTTTITATLSPKDRAHYIARWEASPLPREDYARQVARELGFDGPGEDCRSPYGKRMLCWRAADGTTLFAADAASGNKTGAAGLYSVLLVNDRIEAEDGAD